MRKLCREYAAKFVAIQSEEFQRLGVLGEWDKPYLTMDPEYESAVLRCLADFFRMGNVFKGKRPVYWCASCQTGIRRPVPGASWTQSKMTVRLPHRNTRSSNTSRSASCKP